MLYLVLRLFLAATAANLVAQVVTTVMSTAANRRWTFGVIDPNTVVRHQSQMLGLLAVNLAVNSLALVMLAAIAPTAGMLVELVVLSASDLVVTVLRIAAMRRW